MTTHFLNGKPVEHEAPELELTPIRFGVAELVAGIEDDLREVLP